MSIVREFVLNCSAVNSDFFPPEKTAVLLRDFVARREALVKQDPGAAALFTNLKLLEEEFRQAFHAEESPFKVSNCITKVFLGFRGVPDFSFLTVKGVFFGLKLFFADIEADEDVRHFFADKLARRLRELDLELLLLVADFFGLADDKGKETMAEMAAKAGRDVKADPRLKKGVKVLLQFVQRFGLYEAVDVDFLLESAVSQEMFDEAFHFAKPLQNASVKLLSLMVPSKNSRHMKQLIKAHGLDTSAFPTLFEYLRIGFFKYAVREVGPDIVEERARLHPADLPAFIRYLLLAKMRDQAFSVFVRNRGTADLSEFNDIFADPSKLRLVDNLALAKDDFCPSSVINNPGLAAEFLTLRELGIEEDQVTFVTKANFDEARDVINAASEVGIDSEFFSPDCSGFYPNELALLQIATRNRVFLFDCLEIGASFKMTYFVYQLLKNDKVLKVGLGFDSDLRALQEFFKNPKPYEVHTLVSLEDLEKSGSKVGLAALCEKYLLKKLCKFETISAWNCRPLRRAQAHYAALDAAILLRLFDLMNQKDRVVFSPEKPKEAPAQDAPQAPAPPNFED